MAIFYGILNSRCRYLLRCVIRAYKHTVYFIFTATEIDLNGCIVGPYVPSLLICGPDIAIADILCKCSCLYVPIWLQISAAFGAVERAEVHK